MRLNKCSGYSSQAVMGHVDLTEGVLGTQN